MEALETLTTAESCASFFAKGCPYRKPDGSTGYGQASAHVCFDADSTVECVHDDDIAYAAPGANHDGLHLEHAGYARQVRDGLARRLRPAHAVGPVGPLGGRPLPALRHPAPVPDGQGPAAPAGAMGITTHAEVTKAWHRTTHTDPGAGFPVDLYMARLAKALAPPPKAPVVIAPPHPTPQETTT
jgi:hypothetical protein